MRTIQAVCLSLLLAACASTQSDDNAGATKVNLAKPTIEVAQLSSVGAAARNVTGGLPVQFRISVTNNADAPIKLTQVQLQSLGGGAYELRPTTNPYDVTIEPKQTQSVEMWAPGNIPYASVAGANGPVTLQARLSFDSASGKFQEVIVENVASPSGV
jgi:hypothetical protein